MEGTRDHASFTSTYGTMFTDEDFLLDLNVLYHPLLLDFMRLKDGAALLGLRLFVRTEINFFCPSIQPPELRWA